MRSESMTFILFLTLAAAGPAAPEDSALRDPAVNMELTRTTHGDAVVSLAELATETTVPKEARKLYEKALKADRQGDRVRAREYALAAIALAPEFFQARAAVAVAHLQAGGLDAADRELDIVESLNPQYLPAREIRGLVHFFRVRLSQGKPAGLVTWPISDISDMPCGLGSQVSRKSR
jgi:lipoprotein NlpI